MAERRRYTKRQKAGAVTTALASSVAAAADATGIPETTIHYWMDSPEFEELRAKTREDMAVEASALSHKVLGQINARLAEYKPADLSVLYGILIDKGSLLSGHATSRTETKNLTEGWDDHEKGALRDAIAAELKRREEQPT